MLNRNPYTNFLCITFASYSFYRTYSDYNSKHQDSANKTLFQKVTGYIGHGILPNIGVNYSSENVKAIIAQTDIQYSVMTVGFCSASALLIKDSQSVASQAICVASAPALVFSFREILESVIPFQEMARCLSSIFSFFGVVALLGLKHKNFLFITYGYLLAILEEDNIFHSLQSILKDNKILAGEGENLSDKSSDIE